MTLEELQSASNGIWLCADHARLIDTNQGLGYSAPLLRGWRQLHEAFLVHEMRGLVPPCTLITEINVRQGPEALKARPVALSTLNIITGANESGKTTLLDLLASAGREESCADRPWSGDLAADIHWFDPQPHLLELHAGDTGIEVHHDHARAPRLSTPYRVVTVRPPRQPPAGLDDWAGLLDLDSHAFLRLLREVPRCVRGEVSRVDVINGAPVVHLHSLPAPILLDGSPGNGAAGIVLFEVAIALAQAHSQSGPTLLLIDDFGDFLHPALVWKMLRILTNASGGFQTVVVTHHILPPEVRQEWTITAIGADDYGTLVDAGAR